MSQSLGELVWALGFDNTGLKKGTQEAGVEFEHMGKTLKEAMANQRILIKEVQLDIRGLALAAKEATNSGKKTEILGDLTAAKKALLEEDARLLAMQKKSVEGNDTEEKSQGGLIAGLGKWAIGLATVAGAMKISHSIMESTEATAHVLEQGIAGAEAATSYFFKTIASGDWSNFFGGLSGAIKGAVEFVNTMEDIDNRLNEQKIRGSEIDKEVATLRAGTFDKSKENNQNVIDGLGKIVELTKEKYTVEAKTALDTYNAKLTTVALTNKTDKEHIDNLITEYTKNKELIELGEKYNELKGIKFVAASSGQFNATSGNAAQYQRAQEELKLLGAGAEAAGKMAEEFSKVTFKERDTLADLKSKAITLEGMAVNGARRDESQLAAAINKKKTDDEAVAKKKKEDAELDNRIKATEELMKGASGRELDDLAKRLVLLTAEKKLRDAITKSAIAMAENKPIEAKGDSSAYGAIRTALGAENIQPNKTTQAKSVLDRFKKDGDKAIADTAKKQKDTDKAHDDQLKLARKRADNLAEGFFQVADAAKNFANIIGDSNKELAGTISAVANIAGQMGDLAKKGAFAKGGSTMSTSDAITAGIGGATQILGVILGQAQANKQAQDDWNKSIEQAALDYAMLTIEAAAYHEANIFGIENPYSRAIAGAKQYGVAMGEMALAAKKLEGGQVQTGTKKVVSGTNIITAAGGGVGGAMAMGAALGMATGPIGMVIGAAIGGLIGLFAAKKTVPVFESLKKQYGEIYNKDTFELNPKILADYSKLDATTKQLVDNWKSIKEAAKAAQDEMTANFKDLAGDLGTSLKDSIINAFRGGDTFAAIDEFHKKIGDVIADIIYQMLFAQFMQPFFDKAQEGFNQSFGMITDENTGKLRQMTEKEKQAKDKFGKAVVDYSITDNIETLADDTTTGMVALDAAMTEADKTLKDKGFAGGLGGSKAAASDSAAGQIKAALTEDAGTALMGLWRRGIDESITQTGILSISNGYLYAIEINTRRTADNTEFLKTSGTTNGRDKG